ncbi:MAG: hypothetical protein ABIU06_20585 [Anaerolineales bacterium]
MTPFRAGGGAEFRPLHLMIGTPHSRNEINVMYTFGDGTSNLIYTYGTPNRYYDDLVQFGNLLFYLAYYDHPEPNTRTYMIFQCALDNNDCVRLPFEYQGFGRYTEFKVDESKNEMSLVFHSDLDSSEKKYIDETLIFTYGEDPTCHVEGCKILEELK